MRIRRLALVALFAVSLLPFARVANPPSVSAETVPYASASETTYRLDTPNGRMSVTIHAEYQNTSGKEFSAIPVFILPGAENFVIKQGETVLKTDITPGNEAQAMPGRAVTTLPQPLKPNTRVTLDATYDVPPRTGGKFMSLESGVIETVFIGQGPGSFVLVDVPESGDNYLDPGCLKAANQPKDVKAGGLVRWVCGEVTMIAINSDDADVTGRCAAMDDKCRQRGEIGTFSAYVMSITDPSKSAKLESEVTMPSGKVVKMDLKYFKRDAGWAEQQFAIAKAAFPRLEQVFGFPYPHDSLVMRQSHHIENIGAAGLAFNNGGEVLLATGTGVDTEVTVHELAHQWSTYKHFESAFMVEGLAEYAMRSLAGEFGIAPRDWRWQAYPTKPPLATWTNNLSSDLTEYFYGRSGAFWFAYEAAVGGRENMNAVLARMDDEQSLWPLDAGWFMDQGEWVSGKDLDSVFLEWVYNPATAQKLLSERRAAHNQVKELQSRAVSMNVYGMPSDIYDNLLAWVFDPVAGQVARANKVLDSYAEVIRMSTEAGLGTPDGVSKSWGTRKVADTAVVVEEQRQAIAAILGAAKDLESEPEGSLAKQKLAEAKEKYAAGEYAGAKSAAAAGLTAVFNETAAGKMIEIARAKQESFSPGFLGRIGLLFADPDAELARAEEAYAAGDGKKALDLARGAYETWDGASQRGIQRLAMGAGAMCALTFLVWFLLKRIEGGPSTSTKRAGQGHYLEESTERRSSWRDWENTQ